MRNKTQGISNTKQEARKKYQALVTSYDGQMARLRYGYEQASFGG
jgi:hypothetical protein